MNLNRKVKNFQITIHGHESYIVPAHTELFYCFEVASEPHTHIGFQAEELMSKNQLISYVAQANNLQEHQVQVDVHKNWGTVWGYHYGFGDKSPCDPPPVWISKTLSEVALMVANRRMHRPLNTCHAVAAKTKDLLSKRPIELLANGYINLKGYSGFCRDHNLALEHLDEDDEDEPLPPKKRHLWYHGPSNTGKSTAAKANGEYYVVPRNNDWKYYKGQKYIILEEFKGKAPWTIDLLQELCDCDGYTVNTKGGSKKLARGSIIVVTSRTTPDCVFSGEDSEDIAGLFNRFNLIHMTQVYNN